MEFLNMVYESIKGVFNLAVMSAFVLIGLFLIIIDKRKLLKKRLRREANLARALGYIYIFGGIALYVVFTWLS